MSDRRVARTKAAVIAAFERLLDERGYTRMTVQEILDAADVGRATFYAHFQGKEGVMEAFVASVIEHVATPKGAEPGHDFTGRGDMAAQVEHALRHVVEHRHAVRALLMGGSQEFVGALRDAAFTRLRKATSGDYEARFLTGALVETMVRWVETDFADDPGQLARSYAALARGICEPVPGKDGEPVALPHAVTSAPVERHNGEMLERMRIAEGNDGNR